MNQITSLFYTALVYDSPLEYLQEKVILQDVAFSRFLEWILWFGKSILE